MVLNIEFSINTNIRRFEEWLDRYRLRTLPTILDYKEDKSLSVIGKPTFISDYQGLRRHEILASISKPDPNIMDAEIHSIPFPVIEFELFEPTEDRINVKVISSFKELNDYLTKMLVEIVSLWPEALAGIEASLARYSEQSSFTVKPQYSDEPKERGKISIDSDLSEFASDFIQDVTLNRAGVVIDNDEHASESREKLILNQVYNIPSGGIIYDIPIEDALDIIYQFIKLKEFGRLKFEIIKLSHILDDRAYNIDHEFYGDLGQFSVHKRSRNRIRLDHKKPIPPSLEKAQEIAIRHNKFDPTNPSGSDKWVRNLLDQEHEQVIQELDKVLRKAEFELLGGKKAATKSRIKKAAEKGYTYEQIAASTGVSRSTVYNYLKEMGLTKTRKKAE